MSKDYGDEFVTNTLGCVFGAIGAVIGTVLGVGVAGATHVLAPKPMDAVKQLRTYKPPLLQGSTIQSITCTVCNSVNEKSEFECYKCGAALEIDPPKPKPKSMASDVLAVHFILICFITFIGILAIVSVHGSNVFGTIMLIIAVGWGLGLLIAENL